ncbi:MAG: O-antigen ligase family protein [Gammaproteobacteria bacterium]|nr:O-antigen ligase family protein [Gammaproteobacteria bacterium]
MTSEIRYWAPVADAIKLESIRKYELMSERARFEPSLSIKTMALMLATAISFTSPAISELHLPSWVYLGLLMVCLGLVTSALPFVVLFAALTAHVRGFGSEWLVVAYPALLLTYVLCDGRLLRKSRQNALIPGLVLITAFSSITLVSTVFNPQRIGLGNLVLTTTFLCMLAVYRVQWRQGPETLALMRRGAILYGILLLTSIAPELASIGRRLAVEGNVRVVANGAGLVITLLTPTLFSVLRPSAGTAAVRFLMLAFVGFMVFAMFAILLMTQSRGVIAAVAVGVLMGLLLAVMKVVRVRRVGVPQIFMVAILASLPICVLNLGLSSGWISVRIFERLRSIFSGGDGGIRFDIWRSGLDGMLPYQFVLGAGPGSFQELARSRGMDYYAHSVFVDLFVSYGVFGVLYGLAIVGFFIFSALRSTSVAPIMIATFTVLAFVTHGTTTSANFWAGLMLVIAHLSFARGNNFGLLGPSKSGHTDTSVGQDRLGSGGQRPPTFSMLKLVKAYTP